MSPPDARAGTSVPPDEVHIAGVLVHCRPEAVAALRAPVDAIPGAEVFQSSHDGKLVVVIEADCAKSVLDAIDAIRALPEVLNAALVYQHSEPEASLSEEIGA